jgi:predicted acylesterase/phospholipase RssA
MLLPAIAPSAADSSPKRSLVLAGGGMRVAYQAGVVRALSEAGLRFHHIDGTSGGTINLAMLLSGHEPDDVCERWRTLNPKGFMSLLPLKDYSRSIRWPALGSATGVTEKVFPHLGIDAATIRSAHGLVGTFNLCNFSRKVNQVVEHTEIDRELLVAGISLPILMPSVRHGGDFFTDAVWIRDANVLEAVRRGSDEIWLIWCIGNTARYFNGLFRQYVHMIEMSANGALFEDFDRIREINDSRPAPIQLHVIKPDYPIPLDPAYFFGRVDAATLIAMGYSDARRYLDRRNRSGEAWTPDATKMIDSPASAVFRTTLSGDFVFEARRQAGGAAVEGPLAVHISAELPDVGNREQAAQSAVVNGDVTVPGLGAHLPLTQGTLELGPSWVRPGALRLEASFANAGRDYELVATRPQAARPAELAVTLREAGDTAVIGAGTLRIGWAQVGQLARTLHATNVNSIGQRARMVATTLARLAVSVRATGVNGA